MAWADTALDRAKAYGRDRGARREAGAPATCWSRPPPSRRSCPLYTCNPDDFRHLDDLDVVAVTPAASA